MLRLNIPLMICCTIIKGLLFFFPFFPFPSYSKLSVLARSVRRKRGDTETEREREFYMWLDCYFSIKKRTALGRSGVTEDNRARCADRQMLSKRFLNALNLHLLRIIFIFGLSTLNSNVSK